MLVLTRKSEESVIVGSTIEVKVLQIRGDQVSLGFSAPKDISVHRKEVYDALQQENIEAVNRSSQDLERIKLSLGKQLFRNRATNGNRHAAAPLATEDQ
ncbi:MAG: carbon storage regulator CsrA [Kiritimatiellae bacterium]|nr:carbon storage regulator CsrA [Kiritimatiellia bacterium]